MFKKKKNLIVCSKKIIYIYSTLQYHLGPFFSFKKDENLISNPNLFLSIALLLFITSSSIKILKSYQLRLHKKSCNLTLYKILCYISLSPYALTIESNPQKLTVTALNLTVFFAKSATKYIKNIPHSGNGLTRFEAGAVADCLEEIGDSVSELQDSLRELDSINHKDSSKFEMVMSDVKTWVSAALTNDDTCMDGFGQSAGAKAAVKDLVRGHVIKVSRMTSNALALINMYASTDVH